MNRGAALGADGADQPAPAASKLRAVVCILTAARSPAPQTRPEGQQITAEYAAAAQR